MNQALQRSQDRDALTTALLVVVAIAALAWFLHATFSVTMPIALGFVLALLLHPIQVAVAARLPRKLKRLGTAAAMLTLILLVAALVGFLWFAVGKVAEKAPDFQEVYATAQQWSARLGYSLPELPGRDAAATENSGQFTTLLEKLATAVFGMFSSAWQTLAIAILVFFFTLLMLLEARSWRARLANAVGNHRAEALDAVDMAARKIREYIWVRSIVSLISGSLAGLWFCIVGVDLWYLWGFLFFALNYIPFVGTLIAGIPPIVMALTEGGWTMGLLALAGVIFTESLVENFLDPKLQGDRLSVSPVVLLAGVAFLGWAWSWPGIFLAIPLTATLVVVLAHTERLKPLALLLSNSPRVAELERRTHANAQTTDAPAPAGSSTSSIPASLR